MFTFFSHPLRLPRLVLGLGLVALLAIGWSGMSSYVRTGSKMAGDSLRQLVPKEYAIEHLATLVDDLDATIADQRGRLIKRQVELEYLEREVIRSEQQVQLLEEEVRAARALLGQEHDHYQINGRTYSHQRVVSEAQSQAQALVRARSIAETKRETATTLGHAIARAEDHIAAAEGQRQGYAMRLSELRANADQVAMRKDLETSLGTLPGTFDRGAFQRVEDTFTRIERELDIQNRLLDRDGRSQTAAPLTFSPSNDQDILGVLDAALQAKPNDD
ncbi:MAG: hypothetical protein EA401_08020 [Planctomycetota bacterium]|nr:MAG: hypothetical protein EA401_08020 [Planctomycetota bacterium]